MITNKPNRVQAIKSKFESLNHENEPLIVKKNNQRDHLSKHNQVSIENNGCSSSVLHKDKYDNIEPARVKIYTESESSNEWPTTPNLSYLYSNNDIKRNPSDIKKSLTRQTSDPGKKLHRSHAFRCDRTQKLPGPQRHGSCNGRSETSDFTLKMEKKLSNERLKKLSSLLENQMRKENFVLPKPDIIIGEAHKVPLHNSIPDAEVPKHILDQYAMVLKTRKKEDNKQDAMTDSGVSSETENLDDEKINRIKKLKSHFEPDVSQESTEKCIIEPEVFVESLPILDSVANLESMNNLCASSETMRLEKKNPHLVLTDTLKKALKQPLPAGPPPKKPPRTFVSPDKPKKDTKEMLQKLEQVLEKREALKVKNIYDIAETNLSLKKPKEIHYLCTEILDITQRTLLPNQSGNDSLSSCFNALNCSGITNSTTSLPYARLSLTSNSNRNSLRICCSCSDESLNINKDMFSEEKCSKCELNEDKHGFKCHLKCKCKEEKSKFFIEKEHIYDEPFVNTDDVKSQNGYGTLNSVKLSQCCSPERNTKSDEEQKIYDIPCEISRPATPVQTEFQKLVQNFENPEEVKKDKPPFMPRPILKPRSSENLTESKEKRVVRKFATERRFKRLDGSEVKFGIVKEKNVQLDVDRQNLNRLMNEIYETVTAACSMDEHKPGSFPTDVSDGTTSEESVKLTRSLTEKRKNYVRRVSSRVAYLDPKNIKATRFRHQTSICSYKSDIVDNPYSTFRSWKSFRASQSNLAKDKMDDLSFNQSTDGDSIDGKAGCVDLELPFEGKGLFDVCLLVGLNYMTGEAYVKSVFPSQVKVPPHIENLIFPETLSSVEKGEWSADAKTAQCYSLVLTDERGERSYGYCRRVLPEGATTCLPLCYCLIGKYRAPGFYYKILQEVESHHGSSEVQIHTILQQLFETEFPNPGEEINISYTNEKHEISKNVYRNSLNLGDIMKCKTMPNKRLSEFENENVPEFYDLENNNGPKRITLNFDTARVKSIKRPLEPRVDEHNVSVLLDALGAGLLVKVFGSLLLERKVIIISDQLNVLSACLEALQTSLYPFVWQQPLVSCIPAEIQRDVLEAPLPMLAGMLAAKAAPAGTTEGMLIDLTQPSKVLFYQGDESTILPTHSYKTLKTTIQMETSKQKDKQDSKTRNVMISEAFLRFFVDILGDFEKFFMVKDLTVEDLGRNGVAFDKEAFIKAAPSKQNQYFLEWFTETAMFNHFIQNMAAIQSCKLIPTQEPIQIDLVDTPLPNFYDMFQERVNSRKNLEKNVETKNYKAAMNKKVRLLKTKLRELVG